MSHEIYFFHVVTQIYSGILLIKLVRLKSVSTRLPCKFAVYQSECIKFSQGTAKISKSLGSDICSRSMLFTDMSIED